MSLNEKEILEQTLEIEEDRLVNLQEHKFLLKSFAKNTYSVDKEIEQCKQSINNLKEKIKKLK